MRELAISCLHMWCLAAAAVFGGRAAACFCLAFHRKIGSGIIIETTDQLFDFISFLSEQQCAFCGEMAGDVVAVDNGDYIFV